MMNVDDITLRRGNVCTAIQELVSISYPNDEKIKHLQSLKAILETHINNLKKKYDVIDY
jgi:hypothetical protein